MKKHIALDVSVNYRTFCLDLKLEEADECLLSAKKLEFNLCGFNEPAPFTFSAFKENPRFVAETKLQIPSTSDVYSVAETPGKARTSSQSNVSEPFDF